MKNSLKTEASCHQKSDPKIIRSCSYYLIYRKGKCINTYQIPPHAASSWVFSQTGRTLTSKGSGELEVHKGLQISRKIQALWQGIFSESVLTSSQVLVESKTKMDLS